MISVGAERSDPGTSRAVADLVAGVPGVEIVRGAELAVRRVRVDSRQVRPGDLFVAVSGTQVEGITYAQDARERGAVGVLAGPDVAPVGDGAWLTAEDPRHAAALLAARAWDEPARRLAVLGVTGTNGKTTTTFLLRSVGAAAGRPTAVIGTLGTFLPEGEVPQARTTPEAPEIQAALAAAVEQGAAFAALEVSSHALDLERAAGIPFAAAAFLNLGHEHLDWHGTVEAYGVSKQRLFAELLAPGPAPGGPRAVLNREDPWSARYRAVVDDAWFFSPAGDETADVRAADVELSASGTRFTLIAPDGRIPVSLPLPGRHNVENALAAASLALVSGLALTDVATGLATAIAPPGRFERVHDGTFTAFVDYAHTEDGLSQALAVARSLATGRVIVVLGCGGDRDRGKRPGMGRLAAELADTAIFTTDNPRSEDPADIIAEMLGGVGDFRDRVEVVLDREEALDRAVTLAGAGDLVLAAGKGHETYQTIAGVNHPFPEREILARLARRRDGGGS